ncbi:DUF1196 family protein, partial [Vibrio mimicus]
ALTVPLEAFVMCVFQFGTAVTVVEEGSYIMKVYEKNPNNTAAAVVSSATNIAGDAAFTAGGTKAGVAVGTFFAPYTFGLSIRIGGAVGGFAGHFAYDTWVKPKVRVIIVDTPSSNSYLYHFENNQQTGNELLYIYDR